MEVAVHDWSIAQPEYDRMEARRGRRHAYAGLDPARTALVVVDVVPYFLEDPQLPYAGGILPTTPA